MSKSSRKGYDAEHAVEAWLSSRGFPCYRPRAGSQQDRGDLLGLPFVLSVKNHARMELAEWVDGAARMARNWREHPGLAVVWHKRRGKGHPADWYVTMTGADFINLISRAYPAQHSMGRSIEYEVVDGDEKVWGNDG